MLEEIRDCTIAEARRDNGDRATWDVSIMELKAFIALLCVRGSSALFLCTCIIASPDSLSLPMLDRSQVFSRLKAENDLSHEQVVTGRVYDVRRSPDGMRDAELTSQWPGKQHKYCRLPAQELQCRQGADLDSSVRREHQLDGPDHLDGSVPREHQLDGPDRLTGS
ncbi:hypothetical protein F7725_004193 [Dissostichus mawsoni]|uniref:Uncharacterized protein n=1 Tax=Dissostichus mawsoni TaxID=36200 RepID=A0A7J5XJG4_DISMA|nr:hypothetical protein F7725_004193 [Dissostichus mawsoni]